MSVEALVARLDQAQAAVDAQSYFLPLWLDPATIELLRKLIVAQAQVE